MMERIYPLSPLRTLHVLDAQPWLTRPGNAFWCEWNHWGETPRTLASIIETCQHFNWHRFVFPGSTCVDIGGHSGDTAVPLGLFAFDQQRQRKGRVIVVEPNPEVFGVMNINLELNSHIAEFTPFMAAVTAVDVDEIELADHGNANCNGGILDGSYSEQVEARLQEVAKIKYTAKGISFDTIVKKLGSNFDPSSICFIKIDCEGYDKEILKGARHFITAFKPVLFVEWFAWFTPGDDADLFATIEQLDYVALDPVSLKPASINLRVHDLLCLPKDHAFLRDADMLRSLEKTT